MKLVIGFHSGWGYTLVAINALVGIWSLWFAWKRSGKETPSLLDDGYFVAFAAVYVQIVVGAYLWSKGYKPRETTHVLYGFTPAIVILILMSSMSSMKKWRPLVLGIACLAIAGMGVRGIMTGSFY